MEGADLNDGTSCKHLHSVYRAGHPQWLSESFVCLGESQLFNRILEVFRGYAGQQGQAVPGSGCSDDNASNAALLPGIDAFRKLKRSS